MKSQRNTALIILIFITMYSWITWSSDKTAELSKENSTIAFSYDGQTNSNQELNSNEFIDIETDLYLIKINLNGGDIVSLSLKDQKQDIDSDQYFLLFKTSEIYSYFASSDLQINNVLLKPKYKSNNTKYKLQQNENSLTVTLFYEDKSNSVITKNFTFNRGSHSIVVNFNIDHLYSESDVSIVSALHQTVTNPENKSNMFGTSAYRGVAYSTDDTRYTKESFEDIGELSKNSEILSKNGGWISMIQHYFVAAIIGISNTENILFMNSEDNHKIAIAGIKCATQHIAKDSSNINLSNIFWIGPKNQNEMEKVAPHLELTVDYGWLSFISIWLFKALNIINSLIHNWGFSIIILTLIVRGCMYPLTKKQYTSMAKMRLLTPKLNEIKEKYQNDRQKLGQEMMMLYQKEGVNPLGGCFPILIQMPIFIALYWTLMESTELRHSPFILWINDLSNYDPYFVLPILMGVTMFIIQRMSPTPVTDPIQKKIFFFMPIVFTGMFCTFPAGLTLYWLVSNTVTIIQQFIIFRHLEKVGLKVKNKK